MVPLSDWNLFLALWVNLGAFGPKKVEDDDEGCPVSTPGRLVDNPYSILNVTDLACYSELRKEI